MNRICYVRYCLNDISLLPILIMILDHGVMTALLANRRNFIYRMTFKLQRYVLFSQYYYSFYYCTWLWFHNL